MPDHPLKRAAGYRVRLVRLAVITLAALLAGCNTLPVGEDGLGRIPSTDSLFLAADSSAGIARHVALGAADTMFLGRDGQYVSRVLIRFDLPDSAALDTVTRAELILHPADSVRMRFSCHPCTTDWSSEAVTWRQANATTPWHSPGGDYDYSVLVCTGTLQGDSLVLEVRPSLLPELARHGIILLPLDTGFARLSSGFSSATAPRVKLYWGADRKKTEVINTLADAHIVDTLGIGAGTGFRRVGSGFAFRTWLRFDLDAIPPEATIARAELRFAPEIEYRRGDTLLLGVRRLLEPFDTRGGNPRFADAPSGRQAYAVGPDSVPAAVINLQRLVQYWTAHPDSNFGLFLVAEPEWTGFFRLRVPGSGPDAPRLEILYALPPTGRFW